MTKQTTYKPSEAYSALKALIEANDKIMQSGGIPVSCSIIGSHGIGKTSVCRELAEDLGRDCFKLNLSQITEPAELIGHFSKEYEMVKDKETIWITENMIPNYTTSGYKRTGQAKTTPCPPDWVVKLKENGILILDDFSRGNQLLMQSVMEICNEGTMIGWDLKSKNIQVILSENPDDGSYNVQSSDGAQSDRMLKINMIWDAKDWAERAEKIGINERLLISRFN